MPEGTCVSIEEPNPEYLKSYVAFLKTQAHLQSGVVLADGFDEIDTAVMRSGEKLPADGSIDLALALHMLYFVHDRSRAQERTRRLVEDSLDLVVPLIRLAGTPLLAPARAQLLATLERAGLIDPAGAPITGDA